MLGFRYPFCNGSFDVSNKVLRNPNRTFNVLIRSTNKFGINMSITSTAQHIRGVKVDGFVGRDGVALFGFTTLSIVLLLLGCTLSLLHKSLLERGRSFGLVILLLVLGLGHVPIPSLATTSFWLLKRSLRFFSPCMHDTRPLSSCSYNLAFSSTRCTCS